MSRIGRLDMLRCLAIERFQPSLRLPSYAYRSFKQDQKFFNSTNIVCVHKKYNNKAQLFLSQSATVQRGAVHQQES